MPCASTHMLLADRVLADWRRHPGRAPVPVDSERDGRAVAEAFYHGSLGPDMGFVPGTSRLVSEFAHYVRPVTLARMLVAEAESTTEKAFAWGWAAHVLGDVELHPLVGRAVGERLHGDRGIRVDAVEDVATHVAVEVGLDMTLLDRMTITPPPARTFFRPGSIDLLERALVRTYDISWDSPLLLRNHRRAVTLTRWWPRTLSMLARGRWGSRVSRWSIGLPLESLRRVLADENAARGFLGPLRPEPWMVEELRERAHAFPAQFQRWVDGGLAGLPDLNLETGGAAGAGRGHRASDEAEARLERMRTRMKGTVPTRV